MVMYRNKARLLPWGSRRIRHRPSSSICKSHPRKCSPWKGTGPNLQSAIGKKQRFSWSTLVSRILPFNRRDFSGLSKSL